MKSVQLVLTSIICLVLLSTPIKAELTFVSSQQEFDDAHDNAAINDSIIWENGRYADIFMEIDKDILYIGAETLGSVIFTGASRVDITSDSITLEGFQFIDGNIGTNDVINTTGSYNKFTQINIRAYTSYKYLRVREESRYVEITYCNFENRLNLDDQNILSILVDDNIPGYHKIQYCSFKNFDGTGDDLGIEPIRIGLSTQANNISRCLVEYCYFTKCDGDGEIISSKASQNVYRFNTFENNPKSELVLRHGSEGIVYGNFFLNGKGGVRIREGQDHYIYNNYFYDIDDRTIFIQNEDSDPLSNINIAFNTIVDCSEIILGNDGGDKPTNVTFANNVFTDPKDDLFDEQTGTETWIGNIAFGDLGISLPSSGMTIEDPLLEQNSQGFFGLSQNSPLIDAAKPAYAPLPQFPGMEPIDSDILFDIMGQNRPMTVEEKDLGCNEYPHNVIIQPIATEENTGPDYDTTTSTKELNNTTFVNDLIKIAPNPSAGLLNITALSLDRVNLNISILNIEGKSVATLYEQTDFSGQTILSKTLSDLPPGIYNIRAIANDSRKGTKKIQTLKFIKIQ